MANIKEVNEDDFQEEVDKGLVLVDFWAPWCAPCRMVTPVLEEIQANLTDKLKIIKVNVDENPKVSTEFGVTSIPTIMIFQDGKMVERHVGAGPKQHYMNLLESYLS